MPPKYVPSIKEINNFTPKPEDGERALLNALHRVLDEKWTVYFQPFLNGLRPDIIIFSEDAGMGIFEVKDWDPNLHRVKIKDDGSYIWQVKPSGSRDWVKQTDQCPLKQVNKYKDCILKYEIPILQSKTILDKDLYSLIVPLVYFHCHQTEEINKELSPLLNQNKYKRITVFGNLVCSVRDGWSVCNILDQLSLPYQRNFESWAEYQQLKQKINKECANHSPQERDKELERQRKDVRRGYKTGFWMQGGRIKVCTIHSFKGWELSNILVLFNPAEPQKGIKTIISPEDEGNEDAIALLYTAITRSQENLTVYNSYESLVEFGKKAITKGYAEGHSEATNTVNFVSQ